MAGMAGRWRVSRRSAPGSIRWRSRMSGTRSLTSTTTRAVPRRGRSPARSCSGSWITPTTRWNGQCGSKRKGALAAYRDATLFKVIYGWGLRRTETSKLDLADLGRNPAAPEFGRYGMLNVRYGKAKSGQPPRRRNVASVMGWAVEAVADYVENVRPRFGCENHPALWVTERGGRVKPAEINARFVAYRDALGFPAALVVRILTAFLRQPSYRGWRRPPVHPVQGWSRGGQLDGCVYACEQRLHEYRAAPGAGPGAGRRADRGREGALMAARLDYRWHLRQVMATRGMFSTTDLIGPLAERGIRLSPSQVYRLVVERPERLSLKILMALLDILDCDMDDLIEPVAAAAPARKARAAGAGVGVGDRGPSGPGSPLPGNDSGGRTALRSGRHCCWPGHRGRPRPGAGNRRAGSLNGPAAGGPSAAAWRLRWPATRRCWPPGRSRRRGPSVICCSRCEQPGRPGSRRRGARAAGGRSPRCSAAGITGTARRVSTARWPAPRAATSGRSPSATGRAGHAAASAPTRTLAIRVTCSPKSSPRPTLA